jgi:hypothetical protein
MKNIFFLKLAIGIVVLFGLFHIGYFLYEPVWFKIQEQRLRSDDPATVESTAAAIAEKSKTAIPRIRDWLLSQDDLLSAGACCVLIKIEKQSWSFLLPEVVALFNSERKKPREAAEKLLRKIEHPCYVIARRKVTVSFVDATPSDVLAFLRDISNVKFRIYPGAEEFIDKKDVRISFTLKDLLMSNVILLLTENIPGAVCFIRDGEVCIMLENEEENARKYSNLFMKVSDARCKTTKKCNDSIIKILTTRHIRLYIDDSSLESTVSFIRNLLPYNIVLMRKAQIFSSGLMVNCSIDKMITADALSEILKNCSEKIFYEIKHGCIVIDVKN